MRLLTYWPPLGHLAVLSALGIVCFVRLVQLPVLPDPVAELPEMTAVSGSGSDLFPMPEMGDYDERFAPMDVRPLFVAGRKRAGVDVVVPPRNEARRTDPQPAASDLNLRLLAVIARGTTMRALVSGHPDGEEIWVQKGDEVGGWQVVDIAPRALTLHLGDRSVTYKMFQ